MQRKCACGQHTIGGSECEECRKKSEGMLQRAGVNREPVSEVPPIVYDVLRSAGQPLDPATRAFFEPRFGHDFTSVRVHTDARAAESARAVNALAYTVGSHVVFSDGQYDTGSPDGRPLLAHELAHVVQQKAEMVVPSELRIGPEHDEAETEAGNIADAYRHDLHPLAPMTSIAVTRALLRRAAIYTGRILDEGTCANLVAGSKWVCCDPDKGAERKGKTEDIDDKGCPSERFTPIFTCDNNCKTALEKGCDDSDNWMAIPKSRFARRKCAQDLVICANGKSTHAYVRDKSDKEALEVSRAIPAALGVKPDFSGAIYGDENDPDFKKDKLCRPKKEESKEPRKPEGKTEKKSGTEPKKEAEKPPGAP
jgi:hypothetical protein